MIIPHRNSSIPLPQRMVVKFYNCTNTMRTANDTPRIPVHAAQKQLVPGLRYFYISLNSTSFKIKIIRRNIMFL